MSSVKDVSKTTATGTTAVNKILMLSPALTTQLHVRYARATYGEVRKNYALSTHVA